MYADANPYARTNHRRRGVALLAAVALLALFSMLGISYIRYMTIEGERSQWQARNARAQTLVDDYLRVAIHDVDAILANGGAVPDEISYPAVPVFRGGREGFASLVDSETLRGEVRVTIHDEASKLDINRAAPVLIAAVTGLDDDTAMRIFENTRAVHASAANGQLPVRTLEELATRGLIDEDAVAALPRKRLTVFSGPAPFLNANTMPVDMLAAVLGIDDAAAETIAAARPFETREDLRAMLTDGTILDPSVGAGSRCYRLVCEVTLTQPAADDTWRPVRTERLEAVVAYHADGPRVLHWGPAAAPGDEES